MSATAAVLLLSKASDHTAGLGDASLGKRPRPLLPVLSQPAAMWVMSNVQVPVGVRVPNTALPFEQSALGAPLAWKGTIGSRNGHAWMCADDPSTLLCGSDVGVSARTTEVGAGPPSSAARARCT